MNLCGSERHGDRLVTDDLFRGRKSTPAQITASTGRHCTLDARYRAPCDPTEKTQPSPVPGRLLTVQSRSPGLGLTAPQLRAVSLVTSRASQTGLPQSKRPSRGLKQ